jgi:hypothetical protein
MSHTVRADHDRRLIDVCYTGCVTIAHRTEAYHRTLVLLDKTGYRRIVIDYTRARPQAESFGDINNFVNLISTDPVLQQCRIAFVGKPQQLFNTTVETLADARHYPFKRFHDREAAFAWLSEQPG